MSRDYTDEVISNYAPAAPIKEQVLATTIEDMERGIQGLVMFAKNIPGFMDLHVDDQAALLKGNEEAMHLFMYSQIVNLITGQPLMSESAQEKWFQVIGCHDVLILGTSPIKWRQRPNHSCWVAKSQLRFFSCTKRFEM